jgi:hypothetical protein
MKLTWQFYVVFCLGLANCKAVDRNSEVLYQKNPTPVTPSSVGICNPQLADRVKRSGLLTHSSPNWSKPVYLNAVGPWGIERKRQEWLHKDQGTQILPLSWLLALEDGAGRPFLSDSNLVKFGYIPDHNSVCNPLHLPVGLAIQGEITYQASSSFLGKGLDKEPAYFGFSCAGCHTTEVVMPGGKTMQILGGSGFQNHSTFGKSLKAAIKAQANKKSILSFIARIQDKQKRLYGRSEGKVSLVNKFRQLSKKKQREVVDLGPGRLDALTNGGNFIFSDFVERFHMDLQGADRAVEENVEELVGPVGMPPIYDVPKFDWSYYGHSFRQPYLRALAESVAVRAPSHLMPAPNGRGWVTTANAEGILWLEEMLRQLPAPKFPNIEIRFQGTYVGGQQIPADLRANDTSDTQPFPGEELPREIWGEHLFWNDKDVACARCHGQRHAQRPGQVVRKLWRAEGKEYMLNALPVGVIGTDPNNVFRFAERQVYLPDKIVDGLQSFSPYKNSLIVPGDNALKAPTILEALMTGIATSQFASLGWGEFRGDLRGTGLKATLGRKPCEPSDRIENPRLACRSIRPWVPEQPRRHDSVIFKPQIGFDRSDPRCRELTDQDCLELRQRTGWLVYRARPLVGIWSTAPFLHNNSVPNICSLLGNPELARVDTRFARPNRFYMGNITFDAECMGYDQGPMMIDRRNSAYAFDASKPGNSNQGHYFDSRYDPNGGPKDGVIGRALSKAEINALIAYLKSQRLML